MGVDSRSAAAQVRTSAHPLHDHKNVVATGRKVGLHAPNATGRKPETAPKFAKLETHSLSTTADASIQTKLRKKV